MHSAVLEAFDLFDTRIRPTAADHRVILERRNSICEMLHNEPCVLECLAVGSIARSTAIAGYSDIDVLSVLDPTLDWTPASALEKVSEVVDGSGLAGQISENTVVVSYRSGPSVDVLPGVPIPGHADEAIFSIPNAAVTGWIKYDPERQDNLVLQAARHLGPRFNGLVRMLKWWNVRSGSTYRSFQVEARVAAAFPDGIPVYPEAITEFLQQEFRRLTDGVTAGAKRACELLLESKVDQIAQLEGSLSLAERALEASSVDSKRATAEWRRIFGDKFPLIGG